MNRKEEIFSQKAPEPIGPYSQAVRFGNLLFISGQIAINQKTGELESGSIEKETRQIMENLKSVLQSAGLEFSDVIKSSIFLSDMEDFKKVNAIYGSYFSEIPPARETVAVKTLPKNANVEISVIAGFKD